ncbi:unnamed protein product [Schistosoma rodhaini]|uniref:Uncharacterized protein n=1 Tax=Schistosoma rodhaini TaxID=6188 RepID=A0AA85ET33_9TREM|nr:unnamed protein product [Schistosoma rodhaini]
MFADLYDSSWMYNTGSKVTIILNGSNISALSEYTKMVFLILGIEIAITLLIIIILSVLETVHKTPNPWTVLPWILINNTNSNQVFRKFICHIQLCTHLEHHVNQHNLLITLIDGYR